MVPARNVLPATIFGSVLPNSGFHTHIVSAGQCWHPVADVLGLPYQSIAHLYCVDSTQRVPFHVRVVRFSYPWTVWATHVVSLTQSGSGPGSDSRSHILYSYEPMLVHEIVCDGEEVVVLVTGKSPSIKLYPLSHSVQVGNTKHIPLTFPAPAPDGANV